MSIRTALAVCLLALLAPSPARPGETANSAGAAPQPYARVRVSIPSSGRRAEIRETSPSQEPQSTDSPLILSSTPSSAGATATDDPPTEAVEAAGAPLVLATLNGRDITDEDVVRELLLRRGRETLDWIIGRDILRDELERLNLEVTDDEVDAGMRQHLSEFRKAFPALSRPDELVRAASGMHPGEYRERSVWAELALRKIMRQTLKPTNEQLRGYYAERQADFIQPERVKISQVFIAPRPGKDNDGISEAEDWKAAESQILEAYNRLRMGDDFAEVARAYGSGGQFSRWAGRGELLRELEDAAFAIGVGSSTAPIKSSMGYHILLVEEKIQRKIPPFEEVRDEVRAQFEEKQFVLRAGEFMARLRENALKSGGLVISPESEYFPETAP